MGIQSSLRIEGNGDTIGFWVQKFTRDNLGPNIHVTLRRVFGNVYRAPYPKL